MQEYSPLWHTGGWAYKGYQCGDQVGGVAEYEKIIFERD